MKRTIVLLFLCVAIPIPTTVATGTGGVVDPVIRPFLREHCFKCHGENKSKGDINLERMSWSSIADDFKDWEKVAAMLEKGEMPPEDEPQPGVGRREELVVAINKELARVGQLNAGDPGRVTLRRLTTAEFRHTIHDLVGLDLLDDTPVVDDAAGGEGFTNVGAVQFMEATILKRYIEIAKEVASHAVVGAGPLRFSEYVQQKDGWELTSIARIKDLHRSHGISTGSGEGGEPYGTERYADAFFAAWRFLHRRELGMSVRDLSDVALESGLDTRFLKHIWSVLNDPAPSFPSIEIVGLWKGLLGPGDIGGLSKAREASGEVAALLRRWQGNLAPPTKDPEEVSVMDFSPPEITVDGIMEAGMRRFPGVNRAMLRLSVAPVNAKDPTHGNPPSASKAAVVIWGSPTVRFTSGRGRRPGGNQAPGLARPLAEVLSVDSRNALAFGIHPGGRAIDRADFTTEGASTVSLEIDYPPQARGLVFSTKLRFDSEHSRDFVVKCVLAWKTPRGIRPADNLILGDPESAAATQWKAGVAHFQLNLPQVSHREPIPAPFDGTYGTTDRYDFHYRVRYH